MIMKPQSAADASYFRHKCVGDASLHKLYMNLNHMSSVSSKKFYNS